MLIQVNSVQNKHFKRFLEHSIYFAIILVFVPGFFYFEIFIVCPTLYEEWSMPHFVHLSCAIFLLFNIVGNLIYGIFTNTSIKGMYMNNFENNNWTLCAVCECLQPPRAWHCTTCNTCILKRDHHCTFFACCVGYFNHRYFMMFTLHVFIAMVYAFYYNVQFLAKVVNWNNGLVLAKFVFPLASFAVDYGHETLFIFLVVINVFIGAFTGFLVFYHFNNILKGKTVPESKRSTKEFLYDKGWKLNLVEVFGSRWYLTWLLPFIRSPLPGNGVEWNTGDKYK